jgi:hypothetical protein
MPTQAQFSTTLQPTRDIDCKIVVLDYDFIVLDEISGKTESISISVDAESDIRRTANINMILKNDAYQTNDEQFYWTVGNPYWFDKYVQIYVAIKDIVTNEFVWVNEGIYLVNTPSINYSAQTNSLSFTAVDLMSKLTGLRNGQLKGMTYTVPFGSSITGAIESLLLEQGFTKYLLYEPSYNKVPEDINIDAGSTAYDLLCQLRDINANWEVFFDVDGVFHFQQIPSGKVIVDPSTGETGEPQPLVDDDMWDKLSVDYNLDTNFEDVKNYIEVLGKTHEPDEFATVTISGAVANLVLSKAKADYDDNDWTIGLGIATDDTGNYTVLATPITTIRLYDSNNVLMYTIDTTDTPLLVGNEYYCVYLEWISNTHQCEYLGYLQPRAIAIENNPQSPFYVGNSNQYTCSTLYDVDFTNEQTSVITSIDSTTSTNTATVDLSPWCTAEDYSSATNGTKWKFRIHVTCVSPYVVTKMNIKAGGYDYDVYDTVGASYQPISLDYTQDYLVVLTKSNSGILVNIWYYPIPASQIGMSTTNIANLPQFDHQVRKVCTGDEFDNIYSNLLAEERARYEIYLSSRLHDSITINCVPIYWLDVHQIIAYTLPNNDTDEADLWLIKSISTDISPTGTQSITAIRYYPLYADISLENLATQ